MGVYNRFKRFLYQGFIPVTKSLILLSGVLFLLNYILPLFNFRDLYSLLVLTPSGVIRFPWTLITYPLINIDPLSLIFALLWLWFVGGSLERSWGSWTFSWFMFLVTLVTGSAMLLVAWFIIGGMVVIGGFWLILVAQTWAWAKIFPDREVLFWGIIPIKIEWLAWINAAIIFFSYFKYHWLLAFASISGISVVYLFLGHGPFSRGLRSGSGSYGFSVKGWLEKRRRKAKRDKFKVIKH